MDYLRKSFFLRPDWRIMDWSVPVGMSSFQLWGDMSTYRTSPLTACSAGALDGSFGSLFIVWTRRWRGFRNAKPRARQLREKTLLLL